MTDQLADLDGVDDDAPTDAPAGAATADTDTLEAADATTVAEPMADPGPAATEPGKPGWRERRRNRVSKWDRPPQPKDWRFFVGTLGKILIGTGLMLFGFVAYQLWGTGIETARAQNKLENEFEQLVAEFDAGEDADADEPGDDADTEPEAAANDADDADADDATPDELPTAELTVIDESSEISTAEPTGDGDGASPATTPEPVAQDLPPVERGQVLAQLEMPTIGKTTYVVPGVGAEDLKKGPGHYPSTPLPGQLGNAAIAGHRTTWGEPFINVDKLAPGDELIVTLTNGDRFVYEVTYTEIVEAADGWVINTTDPTIAELTLTSCHPKYTARQRIIVHSLLNPAKSSNVGVPTFYDLAEPEPTESVGDADAGDEADAASDDPVVSDEADTADGEADVTSDDPVVGDEADTADGEIEPEADVADGAESDNPSESDDPVVVADQGTGGPTADDVPEGFLSAPVSEPEDAFSQGWFSDREAFPQIALWGTVLTMISIGAYMLSRRFRRDSVGFLVGIVPFVVSLYFFYQNVNRLLPPGL